MRGAEESARINTVRLFPITPLLGFAACASMMSGLPAATWVVFGGWTAAGLVVYFLYGIRRSRPATAEK
ncbi:amino acid permease C-terminal domain-containing protein [Streptomyces sp. NPDC051567]|uniref:amino acid permease C-terminal domain-containing protein n=1 Tax=Streptomyces sp. NPDC051567 TaxID=3365660 RepID=UPI00379417C5